MRLLIVHLDRTQEEPEYKSSLALYYLRKVATRDANDLRVAYEKGQIGIRALREAAADARANETPQPDQSTDAQETSTAGHKGKGRANGPAAESQVGTNYRGVRIFPTPAGHCSYIS